MHAAALTAAMTLPAPSAAIARRAVRRRVLDPDGQPMRNVRMTILEIVADSEFRATQSVALRTQVELIHL